MTKYVRKPDGIFRDEKTGRLMEHRGMSRRIFWSRQMTDDLRRHFPTTTNDELAELFGVSRRTVLRKARDLGLEKDPKWLAGIWNERRLMAQVVSRRTGNAGRFRKGMHASTATEFKPGHQPTAEEKRKRAESLRIKMLRHPEIRKERARKISEWAKNNPDKLKERGRKVSETKRRLAEERKLYKKEAV